MQTNMPPLTWITSLLNRSRSALVYSKNELFLGTQYPCVRRSSAAIRLEKQDFKKKKTGKYTNVSICRLSCGTVQLVIR